MIEVTGTLRIIVIAVVLTLIGVLTTFLNLMNEYKRRVMESERNNINNDKRFQTYEDRY